MSANMPVLLGRISDAHSELRNLELLLDFVCSLTTTNAGEIQMDSEEVFGFVYAIRTSVRSVCQYLEETGA